MINIEVHVFGSEEVLSISTQCYQSCYVETIKPISNQDKPLVDFENVEVKPPTTKRRAERPKKNKIPSQQGLEEMNCDFFMWCDKVQSFVETTTTCEKDEKIKKLEDKIAWLEDELRGSKSLINKAKGVVKSLPKTFTFLSILDKDGDDGSDEDVHRAFVMSTFHTGVTVQLALLSFFHGIQTV
ncbi:hypothetical protein Taro_037515 [Colocasia esculenta]|uniref:Uncharacterized protein n=1 Tax=Colocasia esculenta TaxID=4460 RepID=A0A843WL14_COLES|nr:hypothetical protein [Colocasia esculenta]